MEQIVRVRETYPDGTAMVIHIRESACSGDCHKCSGCGAAKEAILLKARNAIDAKPGSLVAIQSATGPVLKAAVVLYVLPMVLFFGGYAAGAVLAGMGALFGCLGFLLGIGGVFLYDRKIAKDKPAYTITAYAEESLLQTINKGDNNLG